MGVKERLIEFLKTEGISSSEFSRKMGLSPAYIASMRKSMPEEKVEKMMTLFPQLNREWLMYGEGEMYREFNSDGVNPHRMDRHMVPLIPSQAHAGSFAMYSEGIELKDCMMIYSPYRGVQCAIRVRGDSMEPEIHSGTILFLQRINDQAFIPWGSPMVLDTENGSLVKMLYPSNKGDDYLEARSYNSNYPPFEIPKTSIFGIYRIMGEMMEPWMF